MKASEGAARNRPGSTACSVQCTPPPAGRVPLSSRSKVASWPSCGSCSAKWRSRSRPPRPKTGSSAMSCGSKLPNGCVRVGRLGQSIKRHSYCCAQLRHRGGHHVGDRSCTHHHRSFLTVMCPSAHRRTRQLRPKPDSQVATPCLPVFLLSVPPTCQLHETVLLMCGRCVWND